jgi:hypothetical protein
MSEEAAEVDDATESHPTITLTVTPEGLRIDSELNVSDVYHILGQAQYMINAETFA